MNVLANYRIRTQLLIALLPLALVVTGAALYSSIQMKKIDDWYSSLIEKNVKALQSLTVANALTNRFGQLLYQQIAEPDLDRKQVIDADLNRITAELRSSLAEAKRDSPGLASEVDAASALFDQAVSDSSPVRAATQIQNNGKAMKLMRDISEPALLKTRLGLVGLQDEMQRAVDRRSAELSSLTSRTIAIRWIVNILGLLTSFAITLLIVRSQIVNVLLAFRDQILDVAAGRLDRPIAYFARRNEIGEMSRALQRLQIAARERETQSWVKTEVAILTEALQSADEFTGFGTTLLSRISKGLDLLYGAFYLADGASTRFIRVGAFATDLSAEPREFALGEGLVGQAAAERHTLRIASSPEKSLQVLTGRVSGCCASDHRACACFPGFGTPADAP
jgi:hypothetical protein